MRTWLLVSSIGASAILAGCGGGSSPDSGGSGGTGGSIIGTERIGWDQDAVDAAELATFRYAIYVDGTRFVMSDTTCDTTRGSSGFPCTGRLPSMTPGSHTLELAAFNSSGESSRSGPLQVTIRGTALTGSTPGSSGAAATADAAAAESAVKNGELTTSDGVRLGVDVVTAGLEAPAAVAFAADGRSFVAERRGRILLVQNGVLEPDPALVLGDTYVDQNLGGVLDIALHPDFERNRFFYLLDVTAHEAGVPMFRLARYREAGGRLGERIVLLDGVPASPAGPAGAIAFGPDGKLYVALDDGDDPDRAGQLATLNGKVIRLNPDGSIPDDQSSAAPVYSSAHDAPRSLAWDFETTRLWVADAERRRVMMIDASGERRGARTEGRASVQLPLSMRPAAVAVYRGSLLSDWDGHLFIGSDEEGTILRVRPGQGTAFVATDRMTLEDVTRVQAIAPGPDGAIYVVGDRQILRISPRAIASDRGAK